MLQSFENGDKYIMTGKQYFNTIAHQWDEIRKTLFSEAVREKAISLADVQSDRIAADIGAGTGFITEGLTHKGLKVIAIDRSEEMIREMKKKLQGTGSIDCYIADAEYLPFRNESVDYVFSNMFLHHVENPPITIREMVRILKPSGKLIITDLIKHDFEFLKKEHHDHWMGFERENVRQWLIESGLNKVIVECLGETCCAHSSSGKEYATISIFIGSGEK